MVRTSYGSDNVSKQLLRHARSSAFVRQLHGRFQLSDHEKVSIELNVPRKHKPRVGACLNNFAVSSLRVDKKLLSEWGIPCLTKRIYVTARRDIGNSATLMRRSVSLNIRSPERFFVFLRTPAEIYAHEIGHLLSCYNEYGNLQWEDIAYARHLMTIISLSGSRKLKRKYFKGIPYNIFPQGMLMSGAKGAGLMFQLGELIADKVALQVCGQAKTSRYVQNQLEICLDMINDPWACCYYIVLSREFGLREQEKALQKRLDCLNHLLVIPIDKEDLLQRMLRFFHCVSLKHQ